MTTETAAVMTVGVVATTVAATVFTSGEVLAIIGAIAVLIPVLAAAIVSIIVALRSSTAAIKEVSAKADVIAGHVNSAASKSAEEIAGLRRELELMRTVAAEKKEIAADLARTVAIVGAGATSPAAAVSSTPHLAAIEQHTADTAANTAHTDATVQKLKDQQ